MRKLFCLLIVFLFCSSALAETVSVSSHYSLFIDASSASGGKGNSFDFDSYCLDIYFLKDSQKAYVNSITCFSGVFTNSGTIPVTIAESNNVLYFVYENGNSFTGYFDNAGDLWIDLDMGTVRLHSVPVYSPLEDLMVQP